jgi:hypothetical protein
MDEVESDSNKRTSRTMRAGEHCRPGRSMAGGGHALNHTNWVTEVRSFRIGFSPRVPLGCKLDCIREEIEKWSLLEQRDCVHSF